MPRRRQRSRGFTLVESVVALAVAAIALVALLRLQVVAMRTADKAQGLTQAVLLAQQKMAEALSSNSLSLGTESGLVAAHGDRFTWQREVADAHPAPPVPADPAWTTNQPLLHPTRLRQLTVEVRWQNGPGDKCVRLTTYAAENRIRDGQSPKTSSRVHPG
jgi:type II secretion system protein I